MSKPKSKTRLTIKRPERVVLLCLDASLQAEWEQAEQDMIDARKGAQGDRLTGNSEATVLAEAVRAIEEQMLAQQVKFRLRALPRSDWARLLAENPADPTNADDVQFGGNKAAFFDAVIPESIVAVEDHEGVAVDFDPQTDWTPLADEMTDRQYAEFVEVVFALNRGSVSVPFSQAASRLSRGSSAN